MSADIPTGQALSVADLKAVGFDETLGLEMRSATPDEIVATMEEIREAIPGDFGRDMALAWYYLGGFAHIWSYNSSTEPDNRVVALGSL